ncbi:aldehyde dehydrogenase family protein [Cytobacillus purgationiresistens]|uniref:aldehyde dehydrogenase (NAD(+)) n=1 Tax=Cytobacillus purgationiresistens TaxID=863449 RepID=A0ABU0ANY2_9BACI|nr:aldehyde dehydrogenase family protein [Cytobacillus purgationiresistens]MDQ0272994.1 aldehyde dehydrogenase (NAD+) [Cytobacillus purgationiresistens]
MNECMNFIGGKWIIGKGEVNFTNQNPATFEDFSSGQTASHEDVLEAIGCAQEAFIKWKQIPAPKRGEILFRIGDVLKNRKSTLAKIITNEIGKTNLEAEGEVQEAIDMAYYMGGEGRRMFGQTIPSELPNKWAMSVREPVGVVGAISAFNFPVAVPSWKILPAIILGNTVVWKPSLETSAIANEFISCFEEAGLPSGVVNLIIGEKDVGEALVDDPRVAHISFTGSTESGRKVYTHAASLLKRVSLELGGKNAVIVLKDANLDLAVEGVVWAAFGTSGQRCTSASRVIVESAIYDEFINRLIDKTAELVVGNGSQDDVNVGPLLNEASVLKMEKFIKIAKESRIPILYGGKRYEDRIGHFFKPTILGPVSPGDQLANEEIFGPILCVIKAEDLNHALHINNSSRYGLSTALFTGNVNHSFKGIKEIDTGIVYVNHGTTGAEIQLPFGGTKDTGNGLREAGQAALDAFSEWKSIYIDYSNQLQKAQIDTDRLSSMI